MLRLLTVLPPGVHLSGLYTNTPLYFIWLHAVISAWRIATRMNYNVTPLQNLWTCAAQIHVQCLFGTRICTLKLEILQHVMKCLWLKPRLKWINLTPGFAWLAYSGFKNSWGSPWDVSVFVCNNTLYPKDPIIFKRLNCIWYICWLSYY